MSKQRDKKVKVHMTEMIKLCRLDRVIGTNDNISVKGKKYYVSFRFEEIIDKECPRCEGAGKIPLNTKEK